MSDRSPKSVLVANLLRVITIPTRLFVKLFRLKDGKAIHFRSLRVTLAFAFLALSAVVLLITSSLNMYSNFQNNQKVVAGQQQLIAKEAANTVKVFIQEKFNMFSVAASIGDLANTTHKKQEQDLGRLLGLEPSFRYLSLYNKKEKELCKTSRISKLLIKQLSKQMKKEMFSQINSGNTYISSVYVDETTYDPLVIMAFPIKDIFKDIKGTLVAEVNLKFMWDLVGSMRIGKKGEAYVIDRNGNLLAYGDISRVLKGENLSKLKKVSEFVNSKDSLTESKADITEGIKGDSVFTTYVPLGKPDWAVVIELPTLEAYEPVILAFTISVLITIFSLGLAIIAGIVLSKRITKPIIELRDATRQISKGNLDTRINVKSKNEIGELALNFNQMVNSLGTLIINTKQAIQVILEQSSALKDGSNQSVQTSEAVAVAMQQISQGTSDQTVETEKTANQMNDLAKTIDSVVTKANEVESITGLAKELSLKSKDAIHLLTEKAKQTDDITNLITKNINDFITSMEKIQNFTVIITEITEQTNLLALNAAIEAARAGEAGRGFAIVAEEMNKLAGQSRDAARLISETIKAIHTQSVASASSSEQAHQIVEEQINAVLAARDSFDEIVRAMDGIIERNFGMIATIKNINDFKEKTLNSIMTISTVSEETAASSEEVLASTEEQTAIAEQVKELAEKLHYLAENLVSLTNSFIINDKG